MIPYYPEIIQYQNISETQGPPTKFFGTLRQKRSTKSWHPYYTKKFDTRTFLKHRRVRPRCFSAIWDKKFATERRDSPFSTINFFHTRSFLKHKMVPLKKFSVMRNRNFSTQNRDISLLWINFFNTRQKWKTKGFTDESFSTVRHKKSAENCASPPLWLIIVISASCKKTFVTRNFVIQRRVLYEVFQEMRQKVNRRTIVTLFSTLLHKSFRYPRSFETTKSSPTIFFGLVRLKFFDRKSWNSPIMHKNFGWPSFFQPLKATPQKLRHRETKTIDRLVTPLSSQKFWYHNISATHKVSPIMISGDVRQRNSTK